MDDIVKRCIFFLAPMAPDVGLTSASLGLVRALQRDGMNVGFVKPVLQREAEDATVDLSTHFARNLCKVNAPDPISFMEAEEKVKTGQISELMEDVVTAVQNACEGNDAVIVEGLIPDANMPFASRLNAEMVRTLAAFMIPVLTGTDNEAKDLAESIEIAVRQYTNDGKLPFAGLFINKVPDDETGKSLRAGLQNLNVEFPVIATVPFDPQLREPRLRDVTDMLKLSVLQEGNLNEARVREIIIAARTVDNMVERLKPGALVVTPGDRSDIILAASFAKLAGVQLAGLLLTCDEVLSQPIAGLIASARINDLPIVASEQDTYVTASRLAGLDNHVTEADMGRMEQAIAYISGHVNTSPLRASMALPADKRMAPPAFRHLLVQQAHKANKRIVLPEGDEPRTLQAAKICHEKGIAHCVLLGEPNFVRAAAAKINLVLPDDIEIINPADVRERYVAPMVELRKAKGLTPEAAREQLGDNVVLGTMMLQMDEVDGLVSGAVHTTANTIRPAMQLIKTAPTARIVSSVFFMLMPDQVLVYGDCAVNPEPDAEGLADIAMQSADSAKAFGLDPKVAMISYSTGSSGSGEDVEKVRKATEIVRKQRPDIMVDGPLQYDAASVESVARQKAPDSPVAGKANVFIFPDLNTGNTTYKAVQRSANVVSVGPMLQGLRKPVNDLSRGALVDDIVYTIALTAIQAVQMDANKTQS